jgi:prevent-host-death family protein
MAAGAVGESDGPPPHSQIALKHLAYSSSLFGVKTTRTSVGAFEAKNKFSELLERVGRGAEITITKHNRPVARLVPAFAPAEEERKKATAELRSFSKQYSLNGLSVRKLIDEGRK